MGRRYPSLPSPLTPLGGGSHPSPSSHDERGFVTPASGSRPTVVPAAAMGCAALMIAYQVASKAARDTLFLSNFDFARLPVMVAVASVISIGVALFATRAIATYGPARVIPAGFGVSAVLTIGEWWLAT